MQNAKHFYARASSVEEKIALKSSDRQHAHIYKIFTTKTPDTTHPRQCHELLTHRFERRHKPRRCIRIVSRNVGNDGAHIVPGLGDFGDRLYGTV